MTKPLSNAQIRKLKSLAQRLEPVLHVGKNGLSDAFIKSVDEALAQHELIKIRFADFKEDKKTLAPVLAEKSSSFLVTRVGHVLVLYREQADPNRRQIQI
jgi:RNA-binding protein